MCTWCVSLICEISHIYTYIYYTYTHIYIHIYIYTYIHIYVYIVYIYTYVYIYIYAYIYTYTYIYIYVCVCVCVCAYLVCIINLWDIYSTGFAFQTLLILVVPMWLIDNRRLLVSTTTFQFKASASGWRTTFICYREEKRSCDYIYIIDIIGPVYVWGDREIGGRGRWRRDCAGLKKKKNQSV